MRMIINEVHDFNFFNVWPRCFGSIAVSSGKGDKGLFAEMDSKICQKLHCDKGIMRVRYNILTYVLYVISCATK